MKVENRRRELLRRNKKEILNFLSRVKRVSISLVVIFILFVYVFIYRTMVGESQGALIDKFIETGNLNSHLLNHSIERAEESARSLSSRTMISEAIVDYLEGDKTLEELQSYTEDKYSDGVQVLENILYAERVVGGESIAQYYGTTETIPKHPTQAMNSVEQVTTTIDVDQSTIFIQSPIRSEQGVIGQDHLIYEIKEELESLATADIQVGLWCEKSHQDILENSQILEENEKWLLFETASDFYAEYPIKDKYFYTQIAKADLFDHLNIVIGRIFIGSLLTFGIAGAFVYYFIVRSAKEKLVTLDESRQEFKDLAYFDQLTGVYTRSYLEVWDRKYRDKGQVHTMVLIDMNDFKIINDTYGHLEGDLALQKVGEIFQDHLRSQDLVVRYGGDEFLLILPDVTKDKSRKILARIEKQLAAITSISVPLSISFGMSSFREEPIEEAIKIADQRMYQNKMLKKQARDE